MYIRVYLGRIDQNTDRQRKLGWKSVKIFWSTVKKYQINKTKNNGLLRMKNKHKIANNTQ